MRADAIQEARRQIEICNACRYCEGFCSVFPAIARRRAFPDGDITQLASLCHNCRGCHYACQYAPPHEFAVNLPAALAQVRTESWERFAWPSGLARLFHRSGVAVAAALALALALFFGMASALRPESGEGFYAIMSHAAMVALFGPAFLGPLACVWIGLAKYWRAVGGERIRLAHVAYAVSRAGRMSDLSGGQGQGCNFEKGDRFSNSRRWLHQMALYGFLMCFASTCSGTVLHYGFGMPAPYGLLSVPKLLGVPGGILLAIGTAGLAALKLRGERGLGDESAWGGEMAFTLLLLFVSVSGLALYAATGTSHVGFLLSVHLASVMALFLLTPYSKMSHGFFRLAALARDAQEHERRRAAGS